MEVNHIRDGPTDTETHANLDNVLMDMYINWDMNRSF